MAPKARQGLRKVCQEAKLSAVVRATYYDPKLRLCFLVAVGLFVCRPHPKWQRTTHQSFRKALVWKRHESRCLRIRPKEKCSSVRMHVHALARTFLLKNKTCVQKILLTVPDL